MDRKPCGITVLIVFGLLAGCSIALSQGKSPVDLAEGRYILKATFKFSDQAKPIVDAGGTVTLTKKGDQLTIIIPVSRNPVRAKVIGAKITAQLEDAGIKVEFQGEIVEHNHIEGVFHGTFDNRKVFGIWTMELEGKKEKSSVSE